ncbi:MAG: sugar ABC transporter ATP-binding protein [Candidatus Kaistia colombiensis]|nr:MAG: sugar ABC transporter ATP-binding protein [Kaistia sp.]
MKILEMKGIHKSFGPIRVLKDVSLTLEAGKVLALAGENGAGKSTLMRILSGAVKADGGDILIQDRLVSDHSPAAMLSQGVSIIYQELMLARQLTVAENVFFGRLKTNALGLVDWSSIRSETSSIMARLGFDIDPNARMSTLSIAQCQIVEIAKALTRNSKVIVLDEPSAVLGDSELQKLFAVIRQLKQEGVSFIYISHRISEIMELCDDVMVLRDGSVVRNSPISEVTSADIVRSMVGREIDDIFPERSAQPGKVALKISGLSRKDILKDINLEVRSGEIVGICGLAGAGRTELLRAIVGADPSEKEVQIGGRSVEIASPKQALDRRVGFVPEDRTTEGLFLEHPIAFNVTISKLKSIAKFGFINLGQETSRAEYFTKALRVRTPSVKHKIGKLSGGNQQKCMIARSIFGGCDILLIDEPTRGVDVGAKREIYQILADMADKEGKAILFVSSELPEVLGLSDRILVMREGEISAELARGAATEEKIMQHATFNS